MTIRMQIQSNRTYRLAPPVLFNKGGPSVLTKENRTYDGTPARDGSGTFVALPGGEHAAIDAPSVDAEYLRANGWFVIGMVGTTAQRPAANLSSAGADFLEHNTHYIDTTLGKLVLYDKLNQCWRDPITGQIA